MPSPVIRFRVHPDIYEALKNYSNTSASATAQRIVCGRMRELQGSLAGIPNTDPRGRPGSGEHSAPASKAAAKPVTASPAHVPSAVPRLARVVIKDPETVPYNDSISSKLERHHPGERPAGGCTVRDRACPELTYEYEPVFTPVREPVKKQSRHLFYSKEREEKKRKHSEAGERRYRETLLRKKKSK